MKKIFLFLALIIIFSPDSGEVFSENKFHNSEKKEIIQEQKIEIFSEKKEENKIFQNIPEKNGEIIEEFLEKFSDKNYFSHIEKISYRKNSTNRGLASGTKIYFDFAKIDTDEEFKRVMIHEMGHIFDLGFLKSSERKIVSNFKDGTKKIYADDPSVEFYSICFSDEYTQNGKCEDKDFVSKYSQTDVFEDFAESFLLYIENNESFKEMASESEIIKEKYDFLNKYFGKIDSGKYPGQKNGKRVWDLTLAY